ncbi:hypothetical protein LTR08_004780 [Meristemomyces frigidus]|nr:hypothetical protein LTR08_004780 [Meristemomyces frigidus]
MVRNTASMQSLRDDLSDTTMSSPPNVQTTQQRAPSSPEQVSPNVNLRLLTPLYGSNDHTKTLMNRIATGEATPAERALWEHHVALVKSQPSSNVKDDTPSPTKVSSYPPPAELALQNGVPPEELERGRISSQLAAPAVPNRALQDYQMQIMLLEQQNKKRLNMAKEDVERSRVSSQPATHANSTQSSTQMQPMLLDEQDLERYGHDMGMACFAKEFLGRVSSQPATHADPTQLSKLHLADYQMQLMLLEQQNKKGLSIVKEECERSRVSCQPTTYADPTQSTELTLPEYEARLMLLEQQNKKKTKEKQAREQQLPDLTAAEKRMRYSAPQAGSSIRPSHERFANDPDVLQLLSWDKGNPTRSPHIPAPSADWNAQSYQAHLTMGGATLAQSTSHPLTFDDPRHRFQPREQQRATAAMMSDGGHAGIVPLHMDDVSNDVLEEFDFDRFLRDGDGASGKKRRAPKPTAKQATRKNAEAYTLPFCKFLTDNPTVFHAVDTIKNDLQDAGFTLISERDEWDIKPGHSYVVERNGSSLIAFTVGASYKPGNGAAILAGHVDALTAKLKPISQVPNKAGYLQLGIAPYAGAPNTTWWDRDLSVGGRVLVKEGDKIVTKLVKLDWPIARIPTLAPHFGAAANGPFNQETQMVPIIGLEGTSAHANLMDAEPFSQPSILGGGDGSARAFIHTQPPALVAAITKALGIKPNTAAHIVNWELELFDVQPATVGGLDKEFIFAGRIDDKLCSWAAIQALIEAQSDTDDSSILKVVGLFDDEEIGSGLRQGARGNLLPTVLERAVGSLAGHHPTSDLMGRTYANSFLVSSDVTHAVNPNFLNAYLENHSPHLNVGVVVSADSNGHMTTDSVSTTLLQRCADTVGAKLQVFQIRNDSRSGGTVGPMLSSMMGMRAVDAGIPQLGMHSIRATTGSLDPGLGVLMFTGFLNGFERVDREFRE